MDVRRQARKISVGLRVEVLRRLGYSNSPHLIFDRLTDDEWFALNTTGYRRYASLRELLPALPDPKLQTEFIGNAGDIALKEAYQAYILFRDASARYGNAIGRESHVLDFGCGWGRILRFFMREVRSENLYGIDALPLAIELCRHTNRLCQFQFIDAMPPTVFPNAKFDLIYLYSVFSHLSEDAHDRWLTEFHRIMKPGGILVATTWDRDYILRCECARQGSTQNNHPMSGKAFTDTAGWLAAYDAGEFCHSSIGATLDLADSFYGESCIPASYVEKHWTDRFKLREYLYADMTTRWQNVIVVQK